MLRLPDVGVRRSVKEHNSDLSVLSDWVEASVLFFDEAVSAIEAVDVLMEEQVYSEQDFAHQVVEQVWAAIDRRHRWLNASRAIRLQGTRLVRSQPWTDVPALAFCIVAALRRCLKAWSETLGANYIEQGRLFERVTQEALVEQGWEVFSTGWAGIGVPAGFVDVVGEIANRLNEPALAGAVVSREVKDQGLDLVCTRPFHDRRGGHVVYLVQCASGENWKSKLRTPSFELWRELIRFSSPYPRAIAVPFAFPDDEGFRNTRLSADGLFLDRSRILGAGHSRVGWESDQLRTDLVTWLGPKIASLPAGDS
jgi:hypothetical protein